MTDEPKVADIETRECGCSIQTIEVPNPDGDPIIKRVFAPCPPCGLMKVGDGINNAAAAMKSSWLGRLFFRRAIVELASAGSAMVAVASVLWAEGERARAQQKAMAEIQKRMDEQKKSQDEIMAEIDEERAKREADEALNSAVDNVVVRPKFKKEEE